MPDALSAGRRSALAPSPMLSAARSLAPVVPHLIAAVLGMLLPAVPALAADEPATDGYVGSARYRHSRRRRPRRPRAPAQRSATCQGQPR